MKKDQPPRDRPPAGKAARDHDPGKPAAPSPANVEESPFMDRGDSALGAGESLSRGREPAEEPEQAAESLRRGALDEQYGTKSSMKTGEPPARPARSTADTAKGGDRAPPAPNPGSSEESSGAERDTLSGPRPGRRAS